MSRRQMRRSKVMAIIPGEFCETCAENGDVSVYAEHELDGGSEGSGGGGFLCDNCFTNAAEAAHERMLSDYYGGSGAQSITEQCREAHDTRRRLRGY